MARDRELATRDRLHTHEFSLQELMMNLPEGAPPPSDDFVTVLAEIEDLRNELEFLQNDPSDSEEPDAFVRVPVKPLPHLDSGAIALPDSDKPEI